VFEKSESAAGLLAMLTMSRKSVADIDATEGVFRLCLDVEIFCKVLL
jgi:hypothetical protein